LFFNAFTRPDEFLEANGLKKEEGKEKTQ